MKTNKFPGRCRTCNDWIDSEGGLLVGRDQATGYWNLECLHCAVADVGTAKSDEANRILQEHERARRVNETPEETRARRKRTLEELDDLIREVMERNQEFAERYIYVPECLKLLGLKPPVTSEQVNARFRELVKSAHPDHGGEASRFIALKGARDEALQLATTCG